MENKSFEEITDLQSHVVHMRQKYIPTIVKYEEQNKKIELKLLVRILTFLFSSKKYYLPIMILMFF